MREQRGQLSAGGGSLQAMLLDGGHGGGTCAMGEAARDGAGSLHPDSGDARVPNAVPAFRDQPPRRGWFATYPRDRERPKHRRAAGESWPLRPTPSRAQGPASAAGLRLKSKTPQSAAVREHPAGRVAGPLAVSSGCWGGCSLGEEGGFGGCFLPHRGF